MPSDAMNDAQIKKLLELWKGKNFLTYSEAFDLMCGILPEGKVKFSNERNTSDYMESLDFDDLVISTDIQKFKLKIYFDVMYGDDGEISLSPPQNATKETLKQFLPPALCDDEWWCSHGKVSAQEFKECLQRHNIPSFFFGTTERNISYIRPIPEQPPTKTSAFSIVVPRSLWEGKPHSTVHNAMRPKEEGAEGFSDVVIAYVLFNWCGLTNKTQLGRLLGKPDQDENSYRRLTDRLLTKAAFFTITHD